MQRMNQVMDLTIATAQAKVPTGHLAILTLFLACFELTYFTALKCMWKCLLVTPDTTAFCPLPCEVSEFVGEIDRADYILEYLPRKLVTALSDPCDKFSPIIIEPLLQFGMLVSCLAPLNSIVLITLLCSWVWTMISFLALCCKWTLLLMTFCSRCCRRPPQRRLGGNGDDGDNGGHDFRLPDDNRFAGPLEAQD